MNVLDVTLRAKDQTGAAYDSAEKRMNRYSGASKQANKGIDDTRRAMLGAGAAAQSLTGVLNGNAAALDNVGTSLASINPRFAKLGMVVAAAGIGWQLGKEIEKSIPPLRRFLDMLETANNESRRTMADATSRMSQRLTETEKNARKVSAAKNEQAVAGIKAGGLSPDEERFQLAKLELERRKQIEQEEMRAAGIGVDVARGKLATAQATKDKQKIADARAALAIAKEAAAVQKQISAIRIDAAEKAHTALVNETKLNKRRVELEAERGQAEADILKHGKYEEHVDKGIKALADKRTERLGREVMNAPPGVGGAGPEADALRIKQKELSIIDDLGAMQRRKRDPQIREQERELERERRTIENELDRAKAREDAGRKLSKRETDLLEEARAVEFRANERDAKQQAEERRRLIADELAAENTRRAALAVEDLNRFLRPLLVAAGG